jgi:hypothetical protein
VYRAPERTVLYPSSEKREDVTDLLKNETLTEEIVRATWDSKKGEKVDQTTEHLWEVEWYARSYGYPI